jgi:hypothetical protein
MTKAATRRMPTMGREAHVLSAGDRKRAAALATWQGRHGLTQVAVAKALGVAAATRSHQWPRSYAPILTAAVSSTTESIAFPSPMAPERQAPRSRRGGKRADLDATLSRLRASFVH